MQFFWIFLKVNQHKRNIKDAIVNLANFTFKRYTVWHCFGFPYGLHNLFVIIQTLVNYNFLSLADSVLFYCTWSWNGVTYILSYLLFIHSEHVLQACQWHPCNCTHASRHAGKLICQNDWSRRPHNKFYQKLCQQILLFFPTLKRDIFFNCCVCHKKSKTVNWTKHLHVTIYM